MVFLLLWKRVLFYFRLFGYDCCNFLIIRITKQIMSWFIKPYCAASVALLCAQYAQSAHTKSKIDDGIALRWGFHSFASALLLIDTTDWSRRWCFFSCWRPQQWVLFDCRRFACDNTHTLLLSSFNRRSSSTSSYFRIPSSFLFFCCIHRSQIVKLNIYLYALYPCGER